MLLVLGVSFSVVFAGVLIARRRNQPPDMILLEEEGVIRPRRMRKIPQPSPQKQQPYTETNDDLFRLQDIDSQHPTALSRSQGATALSKSAGATKGSGNRLLSMMAGRKPLTRPPPLRKGEDDDSHKLLQGTALSSL